MAQRPFTIPFAHHGTQLLCLRQRTSSRDVPHHDHTLHTPHPRRYLVFPKKNGHGVKGGSGCATARIPPETRTPRRSVGGRGCKTPPRTRRCLPLPALGSCTTRRGPAPASARRRSSPPARCPSTAPPRSCCR